LSVTPSTKHEAAGEPAGAAISRRRWIILALIFSITVINFIDRQTLSVLAPVVRAAFHLSNEAYGRIVSALQFGLMSGEFPMGWLMDRWGARLGFTAAVVWWSAATGSQIFARSGLQLGLIRFWMGSGECGNYSGGMKTVSRLFSNKDRTLAIGIFNSGSMIGATIAPPLIVFLMQRYGFRAAFLVPAFLGFLWTPLWWFTHKDDHSHQPTAAIPQTSIRILLGQSSTWAVMLCRLLIGPVAQFYWYWIPSYLYSVRHMSLSQIGLLGWIPFLLGDTGGVAGGWAAGWLLSRGISIYNTRRITMYGSSLLCITSLAVPYMGTAIAALLMIGIAVMADNFLSANMFASITDLFPERVVGRVTGLTGVSGGFSGLLFPLLTGALVDHFSYTPVFLLISFMPLLGTVALFVCGRQYRQMHQHPATA
jgi:ACS family hexuronate transporter-like MFS transporter